jgi:hypothetical protein
LNWDQDVEPIVICSERRIELHEGRIILDQGVDINVVGSFLPMNERRPNLAFLIPANSIIVKKIKSSKNYGLD